MRNLVIAFGLAAGLCLPVAADVLEHHLFEFSTMPSQQGWRFNENGDEDATCWVDKGVLHLNTMGQPDFAGPGVAHYHRPYHIVEGDPDTITARLRARVLELEASGDWRTSFSLIVDWTEPDGSGDHFGIAIAPHHVFRWFNGRSIADIDATQWHDYTMICDLIHGLMTVLIDDQTIGTYEVDPAQGMNRIQFGDMMLNANAHAEVAELEYWIESASVPIDAVTLTAVKALFRD